MAKIFISAGSTQKLKTLKGRTGLTPNILSRLALSLSLKEPGRPDPGSYPNDGMEFNRYTLLGEHDLLIMSLLREWCIQSGLGDTADLSDQLRAHINRGVNILYPRLKVLGDLGGLIAQSKSTTTT